MLSSHLRLGLPSGLLPSDLPTKMLYAPLTSPMRVACPAYLILLALITLTILGEEYKPCSSSLCSFLQPPVTSYLLGSNILLSTLFHFSKINLILSSYAFQKLPILPMKPVNVEGCTPIRTMRYFYSWANFLIYTVSKIISLQTSQKIIIPKVKNICLFIIVYSN
jgi:hypothetical protein